MDKYVFVAYKPESSDYCRGCHMASYPGDFVSLSGLTHDELVKEWGKIQFANKNLDTNEEGYGVQIWENGMLAWDDINSRGPQADYENEEDHVKHSKKMYEIQLLAYDLGAKAKDEHDLKIKKEKEEKERKEKEFAKELRRKQLEALKKEFNE